MKSLKIFVSSLLVFSLMGTPVFADVTNSISYTQNNNSGNTTNTTITNNSTSTTNSNNTTNTNNNSNNITTNSNNTVNNTYNISYYIPYSTNEDNNTGANNIAVTMDQKLCIGGMSILDNFTTIKNNYSKYYCANSSTNLLFFNGGPGNYGDFLMTLELNNKGYLNRITYLQWNLTNPVLSLKLGNIKPGDDSSVISKEYGQWDDVKLQYDVKRIIYNHFSYKNMPVQLTIYVNNYTNQIYGYEISLI